MILIRQPNAYTCAVACVAMITGDTLENLIAEMKPTPKNGTPHWRIIAALRARGVACGNRFELLGRRTMIPALALMRVTYPNTRMGHIIVKRDQHWYDPEWDAPIVDGPIMTTSGQRLWFENGRFTSFLRFELTEEWWTKKAAPSSPTPTSS